jgi:methylated-DNA-[protein]-cysteine S-methyltransferase
MTAPFVPVDAQPTVIYDIVPSPVGRLLLTGDGHALTGLYLLDAGAKPPAPGWTRAPSEFTAVTTELTEYFDGGRKEFTVPLAPSGSAFQLAVWTELTRIPFGVTASYGDVATALGKSPVASRAVGLANGRNPISIIIPCHRVIGADGSLTGYGWGLDRKEWLLRHEGALAPAAVTLW